MLHPEYLFRGTWQENMQDMRMKRRNRGAPRKVTPEQVEEMKKLNRAGVSQRKIAEIFEISQARVSVLIRHGFASRR